MNSTPPSLESEEAEITGMRPFIHGLYITVRCRNCGTSFERYQPTVAGIAVGKHACPQCATLYEVQPVGVIEAMDRLIPRRSVQELARVTEEASRVCESWYRAPPFAEVLSFEGVNLGEPAERELLSFISQGLCAAACSPPHDPCDSGDHEQ